MHKRLSWSDTRAHVLHAKLKHKYKHTHTRQLKQPTAPGLNASASYRSELRRSFSALLYGYEGGREPRGAEGTTALAMGSALMELFNWECLLGQAKFIWPFSPANQSIKGILSASGDV